MKDDLSFLTHPFAWCVVPFDSVRRSSRERAEMLKKLGFQSFAYDWRMEDVPHFEEEIDTLREADIGLLAWWGGRRFNDIGAGQSLFDLFARKCITPQVWITGGGTPCATVQEQKERMNVELTRIRPFVECAAAGNIRIGLYNHGGWFGEPENQLELLERLRGEGFHNVGIVYNFHHGHHHLARLENVLKMILPHLLAINLNGMVSDGEERGMKILPLGQGNDDFGVLRTVVQSGWRGPVGILHHCEGDAEVRLRENLKGLNDLISQLKSQS